MNKQDFPSCCAINLLTQFGHTYTTYETSKIPKNEIIEFIKKGRIAYDFVDANDKQNIAISKKIQVIVLNSEQIESIGEKLFLDLDFTIIPLGYYPGHGNNIFMLHYNPNENGDKSK